MTLLAPVANRRDLKNQFVRLLVTDYLGNYFMKFYEIWYVDASLWVKIHYRARFSILAFFGKKTAKVDQKWRKWAKSKPFDEIFWNLVCRCLLVNENSPQSPIFDLGLFWLKNGQNWQKWRKLAKSKPFDEIFWNLVCRCFPTEKMLQKNFF